MAKPFSWSFSKLKNFEDCAFRHQQVDLLRTFKDAEGEQLKWGNTLHEAFAKYLKKEIATLPVSMLPYQNWLDRVNKGTGRLYVEQKYAITEKYQGTEWFAPNAWYRGIGDVVRIDPPVGLVLDWKTGKPRVDSDQLGLMAQCIFSHFPEVKVVRSEYVWLADDCSTPEVFKREDMADLWVRLLPRVGAMKKAWESTLYPQKPGGLCKRYCPVVACPYHGKGSKP
jgi:hypothetical protein